MNSTQITCFLEVAKTLSFVRAAEALYTTQPVVSYQIKSLESELNMRLFIRNNRNVTLTAAGSYLYTEFAPLSEKLQEIIAVAQEIQSEEQPAFLLLVRRLVDYSSLTRTIKKFSLSHPEVHVDILMQNDRSTSDLLNSNEIQLAFCYQYEVSRFSKLRFLALDKASYYVIVSKEHRLAAYKYLTFEDLAGERLFLANTELQKNPKLISPKELERCRVEICPPYSTFDGMMLAVEAELGVTVLPCCKTKRFSGLIKIPLKQVPPIALGLAWAPALADEAVRDFVETAVESIGNGHACRDGAEAPEKD